jgi:hypothetical protein
MLNKFSDLNFLNDKSRDDEKVNGMIHPSSQHQTENSSHLTNLIIHFLQQEFPFDLSHQTDSDIICSRLLVKYLLFIQ